MDQQKIVPIENFIFEGLANRLQQTFNCYSQYCNSYDAVLEMQKIRKTSIKFPYLLFSLSAINATENFYNSNYLARHGIQIGQIADNVSIKAKLIPATFEFNCKYFTDKNAGEDSVLFFMRRWLFARRLGYLKFTVKYGDSTFGISAELDSTISQPNKEQATDAPSWYEAEARLSVQGFISEPQLQTEGVITTVRQEVKVEGNKTIDNYYWKKHG